MHLTDTELRDLVAGALEPDALLRADDHLRECAACRTRAGATLGAAARVDDFRLQVTAADHISDDDLQLFVQGVLPLGARAAVLQHLSDCAVCADQVEDLRGWATSAVAPRFRRLVLAAAVLLAILIPAAIWQARSGREATPVALIGLEALPASEQARVRAALDDGTAVLPGFMAGLASAREVVMGGPSTAGDSFDLVAPSGTGTVSDRPRFEWQALARADGYAVTVFDEESNVVTRSPDIPQTTWSPADPLPRGRTYVWQVTASRAHGTITAPAAPAPPAKFYVIDAHSAKILETMETEHPQSHLLLGILNMEAGIRDAAVRHLRQVPPTDPHADVARRSLERLAAATASPATLR